MSIFTESSWEADAVGDKLSKQLFVKKKKGKKDGAKKKLGPGATAAQAKNDKARKNIQSDDNVKTKRAKQKSKKKSKFVENEESASPGKIKAQKRKRSLSNSAGPEESSPKKSRVKSNQAANSANSEAPRVANKNKNRKDRSNEGSDVPSKKSFLSKKNKAVINKKANVDAQSKGGKSVKLPFTNGQQSANQETKSQRKRKKQKLKKLAQNMKTNGPKFGSDASENQSEKSGVQSLNVQKLEQMLAQKEKKDIGRSKAQKEPESLRDRMMSQLRASRFRFLNETLYNNESSESKKYFKEDPDAFAAYHTGYRQQVEQWPLNPLDVIISAIKKMPKDYVVADFGCGEARLAESVAQKVHSFDLVAVNDKVKACDMAHTPLLTNGVNVVVFCLSLMGTNLADYLLEANRVLKKDGILKIADVESRFENVDEFISLLENYGFVNTWRDLSHNLFYFMDFKKATEVSRKGKKLPEITLKPCLYKKR